MHFHNKYFFRFAPCSSVVPFGVNEGYRRGKYMMSPVPLRIWKSERVGGLVVGFPVIDAPNASNQQSTLS